MTRLSETIKGEREIPKMEDVRPTAPEEVTEAPEEVQYEADEWQRESAMDVPPIVLEDPKYRNMRFRWLHPSVISQRGWRRWKTVHTSGTSDEINSSSTEFQHQTDTVVRRGDLILAFMPEGLARARERYYTEMNSAQAMARKSKEDLRTELEARGVGVTGEVTPGGIRSRRKIYGV